MPHTYVARSPPSLDGYNCARNFKVVGDDFSVRVEGVQFTPSGFKYARKRPEHPTRNRPEIPYLALSCDGHNGFRHGVHLLT
jgi:hypothetical protein